MKNKASFHGGTIYTIDPQFFLTLGVRNLVVDVDNTLVSFRERKPTPEAISLIGKLQDMGLHVYLVSNNRKKHVEGICKPLQVPYLFSSMKWFGFRIRKWLNKQGVKVEESLFIGDQLFTDGIYVRKIHGRLWLTDPLVKEDHPTTRLIRKFDTKRRCRYLEKGLLGQEVPHSK